MLSKCNNFKIVYVELLIALSFQKVYRVDPLPKGAKMSINTITIYKLRNLKNITSTTNSTVDLVHIT